MSLVATDRESVLNALPIIREALAISNVHKIEIRPNRIILTIDVDVASILKPKEK